MLITIGPKDRIVERIAMRSMFEARKKVFVDLLKWNVPVLDGRYEIDQFDDADALYLVLIDAEGEHLASARLLPTTRPSLLATLFPQLCDAVPPVGESIFEITRFCLSPEAGAAARRRARDQLVTGLARFAVENGITAYTGVAEPGWYAQIERFGWRCRTLGARTIDGQPLVALRIDIGDDTIEGLKTSGIYCPAEGRHALDRAA
jgi:N-acyl-L-homoserine lactone synthetase